MKPARATPAAPHVCPHQGAFFLDNWIRRLIQSPRRILAPYVRAGDTVIDLGCGPGFFTLEMARLVGSAGQVVAADLQPGMLAHVRRKAEKKGVSDRILLHQCAAERVGLDLVADFILAYYMVHETPSPAAFLAEVKGLLKQEGRLLIVEPKFHVSQAAFAAQIDAAAAQGFEPVDFPKRVGGRSVLLALA
jgi:ubiquinone/menaquinone biosynthesis C-methylase UbiE